MCNYFVSNPRSIASDASVIKNHGTMNRLDRRVSCSLDAPSGLSVITAAVDRRLPDGAVPTIACRTEKPQSDGRFWLARAGFSPHICPAAEIAAVGRL